MNISAIVNISQLFNGNENLPITVTEMIEFNKTETI